jgi:hypothetical protein
MPLHVTLLDPVHVMVYVIDVVPAFLTVKTSLYPPVFVCRFAAVAPSGVTTAVLTGIVCVPDPTP